MNTNSQIMDDPLDTSEIIPLIPQQSRQSCFICRQKLEDLPILREMVHIILGLFVTLHLWMSLFSLHMKIEKGLGHYYYALGPPLLLSLEILALSVISFVTIFSDLFKGKVRTISVY